MELLGLALSIAGLVLAVVLVPPQQAREAVGAWLRRLTAFPRRSATPQELAALAGLNDVEIGNQFVTRPLGRAELTGRYEDAWVARPPENAALLDDLLAREKARARREGRTLDNNLGYSLRRIEVARPQDASGARRNVYTLVLGPSDYEHFVVPNTILNQEIVDPRTQEPLALRTLLGLEGGVLTFDALERLPYHSGWAPAPSCVRRTATGCSACARTGSSSRPT